MRQFNPFTDPGGMESSDRLLDRGGSRTQNLLMIVPFGGIVLTCALWLYASNTHLKYHDPEEDNLSATNDLINM